MSLKEAVAAKLTPEKWLDDFVWNTGYGVAELADGYLTDGAVPTPAEHVFLGDLAATLATNFSRQVTKLTDRKLHVEVQLGLGLGGADWTMFSSKVLQENLTKVIAKIRANPAVAKEGIMSMVAAQHMYCRCIACSQTYAFSMGASPASVAPPKGRIEVRDFDAFKSWVNGKWHGLVTPAFASVAGICKRCKYNCMACNAFGPTVFLADSVATMLVEQLCERCAAAMLANVKAPKPQRRELTALHRKSFLDL